MAKEAGAEELSRPRGVPTAVERIESCLLAVCEVWADVTEGDAGRDSFRH